MELGRDRAGGPGQIEMALKNIPQISHISGHIGIDRFRSGGGEADAPLVRGISSAGRGSGRGDAGIRFHLFRV